MQIAFKILKIHEQIRDDLTFPGTDSLVGGNTQEKYQVAIIAENKNRRWVTGSLGQRNSLKCCVLS